MTANRSLKVFVSCGYYDLVCSYYANEYVASQLEPALKERVLARSYAGGHAIYTDDSVRSSMKRDVAAFVQSAAPSVKAPQRPTQPGAARVEDPRDAETATTRHQLNIGGRTLAYTARAGLLPIRANETGEPHGHVFYVAYTLDTPPVAAEAAAHVSLERRPRGELGAPALDRLRPEADPDLA